MQRELASLPVRGAGRRAGRAGCRGQQQLPAPRRPAHAPRAPRLRSRLAAPAPAPAPSPSAPRTLARAEPAPFPSAPRTPTRAAAAADHRVTDPTKHL